MENRLMLALFVACMPVLGQAQSATEEITAITERVHVLNARKAEMDVRAQIAAIKQELDRYQGLGRFESIEERLMPSIKTIEGVDGRMLATISYASGHEESVRVGDVIRGKWKVTQIDIRCVHLQRGKEKTRLYLSHAQMTPTLQRPVPVLPGKGS